MTTELTTLRSVLPGGLRTWASFVAEVGRADRDVFLEQVRVPHLVVWTPLEVDAGDERPGHEQFQTTVGELELDGAPVGRGPWAVAGLEKRATSNAFEHMITLGRAPNNDVVLAHPKISKFHAYVRRADHVWLLTDVDSTNGTVLDGAALVAHQSAELRPGSQVVLGGCVAVEVLWPADLCARLGV